MLRRQDIQEWHSVPTSDEQVAGTDVAPKAGHADRRTRTTRASLFSHHTVDQTWKRMDSIIGGLANFKVDTVLSAVDKYVFPSSNHLCLHFCAPLEARCTAGSGAISSTYGTS